MEGLTLIDFGYLAAVPLLATAQNTTLKALGYEKKARSDSQLEKNADTLMSIITACASAGVASVVICIFMFLSGNTSRVFEVSVDFWWAVAYKIPVYIVAVWSYAMAHRKGEMSLIGPLLAITPAIIVVIAPATIHQTASPLGVLGVCLIVVGAYFLKFNQRKGGLFSPLKELWKDTGARFMMLTATLYALSSVIDKVGLIAGGSDLKAAILWTAVFNLVSSIIMFPLALISLGKLRKSEYQKLPAVQEFIGSGGNKMFLTGLFNGTGGMFQMMAVNFIDVAYVNAIKRFSIVLSVMVGAFIFKEEDFRSRMLGASIMFAGVFALAVLVALKK